MAENKTLSKLRAKINCAGNELRGRPHVKGFRVPRRSKCAASSSVRDASKQARIDEGRQRLRWHRIQKWFDSAAEGEALDTCLETPFASSPYFLARNKYTLPFLVASSSPRRSQWPKRRRRSRGRSDESDESYKVSFAEESDESYKVSFAELMEFGNLHSSSEREAIRLGDRAEFFRANDALITVCECMQVWWPCEWKKLVRPHIRDAMRLFLSQAQRNRRSPNENVRVKGKGKCGRNNAFIRRCHWMF